MNRLFQLTFAILALAAVAAAAPAPTVALPDTHAGRSLAGFVDALNSGDSTRWIAFLAQNPPVAPNDSVTVQGRRLGMMQMLFTDLGGFDPIKIEASSDYQISVVMQGRKPSADFEFALIGYTLTDTEPHVWARMSVQPTDDPFVVLPALPVSNERLAAWTDSVVTVMAAEDEFSGTVLIAKDGVPLYTKAVGEAVKGYSVPVKLDTKFNLGSMNKMFTGVAIAQLAQQGKLAFTDPIAKFLPEFPDQAVAQKVTIHHLLTHTSGLGDYWEELFDTSFWEIKTVAGYYALAADNPLEFEPGAQFRYSNFGPIVLGMIIERITGQSYYDYVRENIYKPAGMKNTDCFEVDRPTPNLAIGYTHSDYQGRPDTGWHTNYFMHAVKGGPAGGGYSTVEDLLAFDKALRSHRLLNKAYTDTLLAGKADMGPNIRYAYLFGDETRNGHRLVGHSGGAPGINAVLDMYWDDGYSVIVMSNYDEAANRLANQVRRVLTQPPQG